MTRRARSVVGVAVPLAVLGAVLWRTGSGPVVAGVRALDLSTLVLGALVGLPTTAAAAWRWRAVAAALGTPVRPGASLASCYAAQLLNVTLPTGVAGEFYRGVRHTPPGGRARGLRAVVWERAGGQTVQVAVAVGVLLVAPSPVRAPAWLLLVPAGVAVVVLAFRRWDAGWDVLRDDVRRLRSAGVLPVVVVASVLAQAGYLVTGVLAARAVGVTAPLPTLLPLLLVVLVAMALPLNLAGWGPREGAAAWVFAAAGLGAEAGVATAVAYGVVAVAAALPGAVVLAAAVGRRGATPAGEVGRG